MEPSSWYSLRDPGLPFSWHWAPKFVPLNQKTWKNDLELCMLNICLFIRIMMSKLFGYESNCSFASICLMCKHRIEMYSYLFLHYFVAWGLWNSFYRVLEWVGVAPFDGIYLLMEFLRFWETMLSYYWSMVSSLFLEDLAWA